jgi:hypothetical protein
MLAIFVAILMAILVAILETVDIAIIEQMQRPFLLCNLPRDVLYIFHDSLPVCLTGSYHRGLLFLIHLSTFLLMALFLFRAVERWFFVHFRNGFSGVCLFLCLIIKHVDFF